MMDGPGAVEMADAVAAEAPVIVHLPDRLARAKKVRSGSDARQRRHIEQFRADDAEHALLEARAGAAGLSTGAYMRECCLGDAGPRAVRRRARLPELDAAALARNNAELNKIGSNLNQAVRALNELALDGDGYGRIGEIVQLARPITDLLDDLRGALAVNRRALGHDREG